MIAKNENQCLSLQIIFEIFSNSFIRDRKQNGNSKKSNKKICRKEMQECLIIYFKGLANAFV